MSFAWLGTFRQGQWQRFRRFVLAERRDAAARAAFILAEVRRIGEITVEYERLEDGTVSEKRTGLTVEPNTSLGKLLAAYTAQGGNPLDISMFLMPDKVLQTDADTTYPTYPSGGVLYPLRGEYGLTGEQFAQGMSSLKTFDQRRMGGKRTVDDRDVGDLVDLSRRWVEQPIKYKRNDLEARILKLCDLREQLLQELDQIAWMVSDFAPIAGTNYASGSGLNQKRTVTQIVAAIDRIWYSVDDNNIPDFTSQAQGLGAYPNLMTDLEGGWEDNTGV